MPPINMRKILTYILILGVLIGTFTPVANVNAQHGGVVPATGKIGSTELTDPNTLKVTPCTGADPDGTLTPHGCNPSASPSQPSSSDPLYNKLQNNCSLFNGFNGVVGCLGVVAYVFFVTIPSFILNLTAYLFDFFTGLSISSGIYTSDFVNTIWVIVRDFANIFFILVLLYAAFETVLGIGHGGAKSIIVNVVIIALVVNFSLFFTKVVIDSGNIMAQIFYNKINVTGVPPDKIVNSNIAGIIPQRPMAAALVSSFNINRFFNQETINKIDQSSAQLGVTHGVNSYVLMGMMIVYGTKLCIFHRRV